MSEWTPPRDVTQEVLFTSGRVPKPRPASTPSPTPDPTFRRRPAWTSSQRMTTEWAARQPDWFSVWPCPHPVQCQSWGICRDKRGLGHATDEKED